MPTVGCSIERYEYLANSPRGLKPMDKCTVVGTRHFENNPNINKLSVGFRYEGML